jgi:hypothetical protein
MEDLNNELNNLLKEYNYVNNFNDIPIYYINLKKHTNRNESLLNQFNKFGITNFKRIEAIDGNTQEINGYKINFNPNALQI